MYALVPLLTFLALIALVFVIRPFTTLFHELGHAIPALILTRKPVTIYLGSYGEQKGSLNFSIGPLKIWFKFNPLSWLNGLCVPHATEISVNRQIIYTICGPFASILLAVVCLYLVFTYDAHGGLKLILMVFLGCAVFDLIVNLIPRDIPIQLPDGEITYNDGYHLKYLFNYRTFPDDYFKASALFYEKKYEEAYLIAKDLATRKKHGVEMLRLAIAAAVNTRRYKEVLSLYENRHKKIKLDTHDYGQIGIIHGFLDDKENSLKALNKSLELDPNNVHSLNNRAYLLVWWNRLDEAIADLTKTLDLDPGFSYAYNNLGLAKIKLGDVENGLALINKSLESDPHNSYAFRNLGIYHLEFGRAQEALDYFIKTKDLDGNTHLIDSLIQEAREKLNNQERARSCAQ